MAIKLRLLGRADIDLTDTDFLRWKGVPLSKIEKQGLLVDLTLEVDGLRPELEGDAGSETLGISDLAITNRAFSFTTGRFHNLINQDMWNEMELNRWFFCPYKFFTLWQDNQDKYYQLTHSTELGAMIINPTEFLSSPEAYMKKEDILAVPVKVQNIGSIEHVFNENPYRVYTIGMKSIRKFTFKEIYR